MKFPPSGSKTTKPTLALDIGSEAIKAFLFRKEGGKILLLGRSLQYLDPFRAWEPHLKIDIDNKKDGKSFGVKMVQEFVLKAVKEVETLSKQKVGDVIVTLSPLIFRAFLKNVEISRRDNNQQLISGKEEKAIFVQIQSKAKEFAAAEMLENLDFGQEELFFAQLKTIGITIDGYQVPSLQGFRGRDIKVTCLTSLVPREYIGKFCVPVFLPRLKPGRFRGLFHQAFYFGRPDLSYQDGIFIDIGGKATEIFVVKDKALSFVGQVMIGGADFTKIIADDLGVDEIRARELKENYAKGQLSHEVRLQLKEKFKPVIAKWVSEISGRLGEVQGSLSPSFFLFGGGALLPEFKEAIEQGLSGIPLAGTPKVNLFLPKDLPGIENQEVLVNSPQEIPSLLLTYLI